MEICLFYLFVIFVKIYFNYLNRIERKMENEKWQGKILWTTEMAYEPMSLRAHVPTHLQSVSATVWRGTTVIISLILFVRATAMKNSHGH